MSRRRSYDDEGGGDRSRKRRRIEQEEPEEGLEDNLETLIVGVGEKSSASLENNLESLAEVLESDLSKKADKAHKSKLIRIICECIAELPEKTCIYSTLVGLLNTKNYNLGGEIVELLVRNLKEHLKTGQWEKAQAVIRCFGDLVNCHVISSVSLLNLFESLVDVTMEDNIPQSRSDFFVFCVLAALPWIGRELYEKREQDLEQLLNTIDNYVNKRTKTHHTALRVWYSDSPHPQEEYLDCLWAQISKLRSDKWVERHIYRPYLAFDGVLCEALQHNLPQFTVPPHEDTFIYPYPKVIFRLFDYTDCPEGPVLPGAHSIERYLIEEALRWIIDQNFFDRKDCAAALLSFPGKHKIPLEYMIVEMIFSELFALPTTKYVEICYGSLLLELCKLQPSTLPQVLAQSVELLFERLDTMNAACVDRFASWFAYHLSNFQFRWSWEDWGSCLTMDPLHSKPKFVRESLVRCMRLSYHQRIAGLVPASFQTLLPEVPSPINKFEDSSLTGASVASALVTEFKERCSSEKALQVVEELANPLMENDEEPNYNPLRINVFINVLLNYASKSFTHLFGSLSKYQPALKLLSTSEEAQICILKTMFEVWQNHQQLMVVLVEKLLKAEIIECAAVANWIFSKDMSDDFMKSYVWEILHSTIRRMIKTIKKYETQVTEAKDKLGQAAEAPEANAEEMETEASDAPTEEAVEKMEEKLETAQSDQKNLFLIIFQRFIMLLSEHIRSSESQGKSFKNHWFRWAIGRLQQIFFEHHDHVFKYVSTFESLLFTADLDQHILLIFKQFCSLRS